MSLLKIKNDGQALFAIILASIAILFFTYKQMILHPNIFTFGPDSGDALKNYYTILHYVRYGEDMLFTGFNYPHGEYLHFIDSHPIIAVFLRFINEHIFEIYPYTLGIINYWLMLGIVITPIVIYYLLRHFKLPIAYSLIVALIIGFLSPQLERLSSHYALSYSYFIPLGWLIALKIYESKKTQWGLHALLILLLLFAAWIHAYFTPMIGMLVLLMGFFSLFTDNKKYSLIISPVIGLALSLLSLKITDGFIDRETFPWGVYNYHSYVESVFLPYRGQLSHLLQKLVKFRSVPWEGMSYVGILGIPIILSILFLFIKNLISPTSKKQIFNNSALSISFLSSLVALTFSSSLIHRVLPEIVQLTIKPFFQFRSLGRFTWIFYYVFTVSMAYLIYCAYKNRTSLYPKLSLLFISAALFIWSYDAFQNVLHIKKRGVFNHGFFAENKSPINDILTVNGYNTPDFQASLPLPMSYLDSKYLWFHSSYLIKYAMQLSYQNNLPIIGSYAARPSIDHSTSLRQLQSEPWIDKQLLKKMDDRPLLVIQKFDPKTDYEKTLISKCELIAKTDLYNLYKLDISKLNYLPDHPDLMNADTSWTSIADVLQIGEQKTIPENTPIIYHSFDQENNATSINGQSKKINVNKKNYGSYTIDISPLKMMKKDIEISFWVFIDHTTIETQEIFLQELDSNKNIVIERNINWRGENNVLDRWVRVDQRFRINDITTIFNLIIKSEDCIIDELVIKPVGADVIIKSKNKIMVNNYPMKNN